MSRAASPGEIVTTANGVKIIGHLNMPVAHRGRREPALRPQPVGVPGLLVDKEKKLHIDRDEIIKATLLTLDGAVVNPALLPAEPAAAVS